MLKSKAIVMRVFKYFYFHTNMMIKADMEALDMVLGAIVLDAGVTRKMWESVKGGS